MINRLQPGPARLFLVLGGRGLYGFDLYTATTDEADARRRTKAIGGVLAAVDVDVLLDLRPDSDFPKGHA